MSSHINSKLNEIWRKLRNKEYRSSFVASQISNTIAAQIFSLREARGWKQAEVAAKAGMRQSRISDLEDPNYENYETKTLVKLASAFDVGLVIRFVPFSELAKWSASLSPRDFLPTEFLKDGIVNEIEDTKSKVAKGDQPVGFSIEANEKLMESGGGPREWQDARAGAKPGHARLWEVFSAPKPQVGIRIMH